MNHLDIDIAASPEAHPLDWLENMFVENQWFFERPSDNELMTGTQGSLTDYQLFFQWRADIRLLNLSCRLDAKSVKSREHRLYELVARANERLWAGHFEIDHDSSSLVFRHGLLLFDNNLHCRDQLKELLDVTLSECERYYPAFQYVLWGNLLPKEALDIVVMETVGSA